MATPGGTNQLTGYKVSNRDALQKVSNADLVALSFSFFCSPLIFTLHQQQEVTLIIVMSDEALVNLVKAK